MSLKDNVEKYNRDKRAAYEKKAYAMLRDWLGLEPKIVGSLAVKEPRLSNKVEISGQADFEIERGKTARIAFETTFKIGDGFIYTDATHPVKVTLLPEKARAKSRRHLLELYSGRK